MKNSSTLTVKGQLTVPKELRDAFGWKAGDEVEFVREPDGVKIIRARRRRRGARVVESLKQVRGWKRGLTTEALMKMTRGLDP